MTGDLRLRITVAGPPAGVAMQVQRGRCEFLPPSRTSPDSISFDFAVRLGEPRKPGVLRFLGEFAQGPAAERFVYVNSGQSAGQAGSPWVRRAKVKLGGIAPEQARRVLDDVRLCLEARIAGLARDGGPMCASVPLLGDGWTVRELD